MSAIQTSYWDFKDALAGDEEAKPTKAYEGGAGATPATPTTVAEAPKEALSAGTEALSIEKPDTEKPETKWDVTGTDYKKQEYGPGQVSITPGEFKAPEIDSWYKGLFKPVEEKVTGTREQLGSSTKAFTEEAGPVRTYDSTGAQEQLSNIINASYGKDSERQTAIGEAQSLVGAQYGGPSTLDEETMQQIRNAVGGLRSDLPELRKASGASYLLGEQFKGLTPGQLRFETQRLMRTPEYFQALQGYQSEAENLYQDALRAQQEAKDIAGTRTETEAEIAAKSRGFLTGEQENLSESWSQEIAKLNQEEAARQAAWDKFQETGNLQDLIAAEDLVKAQTRGVEPVAEMTPQQKEERKEALYTDIWSRPQYAEIANIPEMIQNPNKGTELVFPPDWWTMHSKDFDEKQWKVIKELARQRQREIGRIEQIVQGETPSARDLQTEARTMSEQFPGLYNDIINNPEYADIAQYLPLRQVIDKKGRAQWGLQYQKKDGSWDIMQLSKVNSLTQAQKAQLIKRQAELEKLGIGDVWDPTGKTHLPQGEGLSKAAQGVLAKMSKEDAKQAIKGTDSDEITARDIAPLYYTQVGTSPLQNLYQPEDIRPYAQYAPQVSPSRENISTADQRKVYNMVSDILTQADKVVEQAPYTAAQMLVEVDQYLANEEEVLAQRHETLDDRRQQWLKAVQKARKQYKKAHSGIGGALRAMHMEWLIPVLKIAAPLMLGPMGLGMTLGSGAMGALGGAAMGATMGMEGALVGAGTGYGIGKLSEGLNTKPPKTGYGPTPVEPLAQGKKLYKS